MSDYNQSPLNLNEILMIFDVKNMHNRQPFVLLHVILCRIRIGNFVIQSLPSYSQKLDEAQKFTFQ
jgi:hypothetical protein